MGTKDPKLVGLVGDPNVAGMDSVGGFTQEDVNAEGRRQKGRLPQTLEELRQGQENRAARAVHPADRSGMQGTTAAQGVPHPLQAQRQLSPDELMEQAKQMLDSQAQQHQAVLGQGPSVGVRDSAGGQVPDWLVKHMEE